MIRWTIGVVAGVSAAHADPHVEVSGFVGADYFGDNIGLGNSYAPDQVPGTSALVGARFAFFPWTAIPEEHTLELGLEAEVGFAPATTSGDPTKGRNSYFAPVFAWRGHLIARIAGDTVRPFLLAGAGGMSVASSSPFIENESDPIYYWGPGLDLPVTEATSLRFDLRMGVMPGRDGWTETYELQFGIAGTFGGHPEKPVPVVVEPPPAPPPPVVVVEPPPPPPVVVVAPPPPNPDRDGDGIPNEQDKCPDQPETVNHWQDADGCPDELPAEIVAGLAVDVAFEPNRARITPAAKKALAPTIAALRKYREVTLTITGHGKGDLGKRRAEGVKWFLVDQGVIADRIKTVGGDEADRAIDLQLP